ncbi:Clr5 domain-containing protein [Durotheca rogersii]|uniref:Clr5 domain-containing protein n=1 Tax=Durotheca rogersii TaxID=419775 RepID=UPI00221FD13E|nr:Clr5 domain-containing protein [Durotheca rogersii]KAI5865098.1 Clr5 domain-containing protein [Durotheca rogersii]
MATRTSAPRIDIEVWESKKTKLYELYVTQGKSLKEVQEEMKEPREFTPTEKQYRYRFEKWGWHKYRLGSGHDLDNDYNMDSNSTDDNLGNSPASPGDDAAMVDPIHSLPDEFIRSFKNVNCEETEFPNWLLNFRGACETRADLADKIRALVRRTMGNRSNGSTMAGTAVWGCFNLTPEGTTPQFGSAGADRNWIQSHNEVAEFTLKAAERWWADLLSPHLRSCLGWIERRLADRLPKDPALAYFNPRVLLFAYLFDVWVFQKKYDPDHWIRESNVLNISPLTMLHAMCFLVFNLPTATSNAPTVGHNDEAFFDLVTEKVKTLMLMPEERLISEFLAELVWIDNSRGDQWETARKYVADRMGDIDGYKFD